MLKYGRRERQQEPIVQEPIVQGSSTSACVELEAGLARQGLGEEDSGAASVKWDPNRRSRRKCRVLNVSNMAETTILIDLEQILLAHLELGCHICERVPAPPLVHLRGVSDSILSRCAAYQKQAGRRAELCAPELDSKRAGR
jgi:hypothetical protein